MNRRQFMGAALAGIIASLALPFERFAEWCRELFGRVGLESNGYELRLTSYANFVVGMPVYIGTISLDNEPGEVTVTAVDRDRGVITVSA